ncbi:unnamed protein product [Rotaria magnacalcarata]
MEPDLLEQAGIDRSWESQIVNAPATVNLLGQLMVLSSKRDFSFEAYMPNQTYTFITHRQSFRATLIQIANEGWHAFHGAHMNMDKIQMYMQLIPGHIATSIRILTTVPTPGLMSRILPRTFNEIERIGNECTKLSNDTHNKFLAVLKLIGEVILVTGASQGIQEKQLRDVEIRLNVARIKQEQLANVTKTVRLAYDRAADNSRRAHAAYREAIGKIPTGFGKFLKDLGGAIVSVVKTAGTFIVAKMTGGPSSSADGTRTGGADVNTQLDTQETSILAALLSKQLYPMVSNLTAAIKSQKNGTLNLDPQLFEATQVYMSSTLQLIRSGSSTQDIRLLFASGLNVTANIITELKKASPENIQELLSTLERIHRQAQSLSVPAIMTGASSPNNAQGSSGDDNERFIAQMEQQRLKDAEAREDAYFNALSAKEEEAAAIVTQIATYDLTRIDYKELLDLMTKGIKLLSEINEKWSELTAFFAALAGRAEVALSGTIKTFLEYAREAGAASNTKEERDYMVVMLKSQTDAIHTQAYAIFIMSRTYLDMSNTFLRPRLGGLAKMLVANDDKEREKLREELTESTKVTQAQVKALISERRANYSVAMAARRKSLEVVILRLGGTSVEDEKAIATGMQQYNNLTSGGLI